VRGTTRRERQMNLEGALKGVTTDGPVPGHQQIAQILREQITSGDLACGDRLPPERSLAQMCGVSRSTVRQALDSMVAEGLVSKYTGRGIFVSSPPKPTVVGIVMPSSAPRYHWGTVLSQAIVSEARTQEWEVVTYLLASNEDRSRLERDLRNGRLHGILSMFGRQDPNRRVPEVIANLTEADEYQVYIDYYSAIHQAASFLVDRGRRRIGMAAYQQDFIATREGMRALREVLQEHGLPFRAEWIVQHGGLEEQGEAAVRQIWSQDEHPDGFIFMDDWQGLGGTRALGELGVRVPEDLLVVTHMNRGYRPPYPVSVAGMQVDPHGIAREMVSLLGRLQRGEAPLHKLLLVEPSLVVPDALSP
jgi:DNA-binding LacI/PurR family transcriptional regulator